MKQQDILTDASLNGATREDQLLSGTGKDGQPETSKVLVLEDVPADVELIVRELRKSGIQFMHEDVYTREAFLKALEEFNPDIILSDYAMPQFSGMDALRLMQERGIDLPFIIVTGSQNEEIAVECMKAGAADYIIKDRLRRLGPAVEAALGKWRLKQEKARMEEAARLNRVELEMAVAGSGGAEWEITIDPLHHDEILDAMKMSPRIKGFIGFSDNEFPSSFSAWFARIHPEDISRVEAAVKAHREGHMQAHAVEYRIRHKDGSWRWISSRGQLIRNEHGQPVRWAGIDWDVTERKLAEEELRESEERYRTLYESMKQGVHEIDASGRLVSANPASAEILGIDTSQMTGIPITEIYASYSGIIQEDGRPFGEKDQISLQVLKKGEIIEDRLVKIFNPKKQEYRWISVYSVPKHKPGEGKPVGVFTIYSDVTELKNTQLALHRTNEELEHKVEERTSNLMQTTHLLEEQKELLQTVIDHIPVIITLCSPSGEIRLVNKEFKRLTGWSLDEARDHNVSAACFPDPSHRKEVMDLVMKGDPGWREFDVTTRSGGTLRILWAAVGLSEGHIGIGIDITERKNMEKDLLRLAAAVDQAGDAIALASPEGVFEYMNPAYERLSGYRHDEFIGKKIGSFKEFYAGYDIWKVFEENAKEGKTWRGRQKRRKRTGEVIDVDVTMTPVHDKIGKIINYVWVVRDITQELKMQEQIMQAQKMEAIGSLAGGIAHDLKNILTPILMNTEIAIEDVGDNHPARPVLEDVLYAAKLGKDLIQQILTFSRRTPPEKGPVNIPEVIKETLAFLRSTLPSTIQIHEELEDSSVMAVADPTQIKQVLLNLGGNAGQAMHDKGGTLDVCESVAILDEEEASKISPDLTPGPYIEVTVHDTGHGIDEQTVEHIFEPFFTTKKGESMGLGLAVAHGIVKNHQGAIIVQSEPGKGSTFTVYLPVLREKGA